MLYRAFFFASIFPACYAMDPCVNALQAHAKAKYEQMVNKELLKVIRVGSDNNRELLRKVQEYYQKQPAQQTTYWAYLSQPFYNLEKICAYLNFFRTTSLEVRKAIPQEDREYSAVDSSVFSKLHKEWPIISVLYDLKALDSKILEFSQWMERFPSLAKNDEIKAFFFFFKKDYANNMRAIEVCTNYKKYMNPHVTFPEGSE